MDEEPHGEEDGIPFSRGQKKEERINKNLLQNDRESYVYWMFPSEAQE